SSLGLVGIHGPPWIIWRVLCVFAAFFPIGYFFYRVDITGVLVVDEAEPSRHFLVDDLPTQVEIEVQLEVEVSIEEVVLPGARHFRDIIAPQHTVLRRDPVVADRKSTRLN